MNEQLTNRIQDVLKKKTVERIQEEKKRVVADVFSAPASKPEPKPQS